jgi:hypothetical protein
VKHLEHEKEKQQKAIDKERERRLKICSDELKFLQMNEAPDPEERGKPFR